ncbi:MAG: hypothetical protein WBC44_02865 [Planctomycetaceae bacterium]
MPLITQVAEAVLAELDATTFSQSFTAQRAYLPRAELAALRSLCVTVVPSHVTIATVARGQTQQDVAVDVAVQRKLTSEENGTLDSLLALAEEIAAHFTGKRLDSFPAAAWVKTEFKPIYAPEHIEQLRTFTSVLTLTFRVFP